MKSFTELLKSPQNITPKDTEYLTSIIDEYPYFQAARAIHLKNLKNNESFKYNSELKKTAAYTTDRTVLFDFISSAGFTKEKTGLKEVHQQITAKISAEEPMLVEEKLEIGKPFSFTQTETHSFNQWLQLSSHKKIDREKNKQLNKTDIIDNFIKQNPKISKVSKDADKKEVHIIEKQESYLMTETLAKVYLEQKNMETQSKLTKY